jgi:hypothetical protein
MSERGVIDSLGQQVRKEIQSKRTATDGCRSNAMSHKPELENESTQQQPDDGSETNAVSKKTHHRGTGLTHQEHNAVGSKVKSKGDFLLGALSGVAAAVIAPLFTKQLRPVVRGAIKGGIVTGRYVQRAAEGVVEDFQDITAEAKAELAEQEAVKPEVGKEKTAKGKAPKEEQGKA